MKWGSRRTSSSSSAASAAASAALASGRVFSFSRVIVIFSLFCGVYPGLISPLASPPPREAAPTPAGWCWSCLHIPCWASASQWGS